MDTFVEIESQSRTSLVRLSRISLLELAEEEEGYSLTIYIAGEDSIRVEAEAGNEKAMQRLYGDLKAKLEAL